MLLSVIVWSVSNMIILTYIVRGLMLLAFPPLCMLMYAMAKDVMTWGQDEN